MIKKLCSKVDVYYYFCTKEAKIKKMPNGKYRVLSEKGKNLGTFDSKSKAKKRLRQVEFFKHKKASKEKEIDLSKLDEFSYSAIMRELRKKATKQQVVEFMKIFKSFFDKALISKKENPAEEALPKAFMQFKRSNPIRVE